MNILTHLFSGLTLSSLLDLNIYGVIIGSVLPDFDMFSSIPHRTLTHSFIFIIILSLILYLRNKRLGVSFFIGLLTHLNLDVITTQGIMLLYPFNKFFSFNLFNSSNNNINLLTISIFTIIILNSKFLRKKLIKYNYLIIQIITYSILIFPLILSIILGFNQKFDSVNINQLLNNSKYFEGRDVIINGTICSNITFKHYSEYSDYLIFNLCNNNNSLIVWMISGVNNNIKENDNLTIYGKFTNKYEEPEINYITRVILRKKI